MLRSIPNRPRPRVRQRVKANGPPSGPRRAVTVNGGIGSAVEAVGVSPSSQRATRRRRPAFSADAFFSEQAPPLVIVALIITGRCTRHASLWGASVALSARRSTAPMRPGQRRSLRPVGPIRARDGAGRYHTTRTPCAAGRLARARHPASGRPRARHHGGRANSSPRATARRWRACCPRSSKGRAIGACAQTPAGSLSGTGSFDGGRRSTSLRIFFSRHVGG